MTTALIMLSLILFGGVAWRDLRFATVTLFGVLPSYLVRFSLGPVPTTLLECFVIILLAVWLAKHHGWRTSLRSLGLLRVPLLLGLAAACFAAAQAPDVFAALGILKAYYIEPALMVLLLVSTFRARRDWYALLGALLVSGTVVALLGIMQYATSLGIPSPWNLELRITSVFDYPNAVGLFLAPLLSAAVVAFFATKLPSYRVGLAIAGFFIAAAIALAQTEAAIIAVPAALTATFLISTAPKTKKWLVTTAVIVLAIVPVLLLPIVRKKITLGDVSGQARLAMWHETMRFLGDHWLLGAGLSGYPSLIASYHDASFFEIFQYPHNIFLNIWVELGALGIIAFILGVAAAGRIIARHRGDAAMLAVCAALLTMGIHGLVDVPFFKNDLAMLNAGFLAALVTLPTLKKT